MEMLNTWTGQTTTPVSQRILGWTAGGLFLAATIVPSLGYETTATSGRGAALESALVALGRVLGVNDVAADQAGAVLIGRVLLAAFVVVLVGYLWMRVAGSRRARAAAARFSGGGVVAPIYPPTHAGATNAAAVTIDVHINDQGHVVFHTVDHQPAPGAPREYWLHAWRRELTTALQVTDRELLINLQNNSALIARNEQQFLASLGVPFQVYLPAAPYA